MVPDDLVRRFMALFDGFSKAHGRYEIKRAKDSGKLEGRAVTVHSEPTERTFKEHLNGSGPGIGIIPLRDDDTCLFAAIDIDINTIDHAALEKKCAEYPLVICRSKSGGAHLYLFLKDPTPAEAVLATMTEIAAAIGYGGVEVFPKQTTRANEKDIGNWINLPYFEADKTLRMAIRNGERLSLEEFLDHAESKRGGLPEVAPDPGGDGATSNLFEEGPPCLNHLARHGGLPEGSRNDGLYNVAVYLRKRFPDTWENELQKYNVALCDPPVSLQEVLTITKSVRKKDYHYRCKLPPIAAHCNRRKCLKCMFGVGETGQGGPPLEIGNITKYEGDPVLWAVEVAGFRIMVDTDTFFTQRAFMKACMEKINRFGLSMPQGRWERFLNDLLKNVDTVPVPEDAGALGQFWVLVEAFAMDKVQARHRDEVLRNKPFRDGGRVYFRSRALFDYLDNRRFRYINEHKVWQQLRERGGEQHNWTVKGKTIRVWSIPDFQAIDDSPTPPPDFSNDKEGEVF